MLRSAAAPAEPKGARRRYRRAAAAAAHACAPLPRTCRLKPRTARRRSGPAAGGGPGPAGAGTEAGLCGSERRGSARVGTARVSVPGVSSSSGAWSTPRAPRGCPVPAKRGRPLLAAGGGGTAAPAAGRSRGAYARWFDPPAPSPIAAAAEVMPLWGRSRGGARRSCSGRRVLSAAAPPGAAGRGRRLPAPRSLGVPRGEPLPPLPPPPGAMAALLVLVLLAALGGRALLPGGRCAAPLADLRSQISGVETLLEEFRRQLQQEEPGPPATAGGGGGGGEPCGGSGGFSARPDSIIRTKDSIAAGATFLRAPGAVSGWRQCLDACCAEPRCTLAVVQGPARPRGTAAEPGCYLFNCTHRGRPVCRFAPHRGYSSYSRRTAGVAPPPTEEEFDEPPQCQAGQDIVLQSPVDWVLLDGRESSDDHGIVHYEWTLLQGDSAVEMQVPQPGTLKLSHIQEGGYIFQLTVTDTAGQRSSDNVSVTVLPMVHSAAACVGVCSRYQFICDDGCCIDITFACDGVRQCPDGSDETFCQNLSSGRKTVTHAALGTTQQRTAGLTENTEENSAVNTLKATAKNQPLLLVDTDMSNQSLSQGPKKQISGFVPDNSSSGKRTDDKNGDGIMMPKRDQLGGGRPVPETGAVLPLALGLAITALLLLMVACRLRLVKQKLKKARPITSEESDYLINGMYL
ncbi:low-density lipoprotein receptor-related protein 11 [Melospiza melodia melodia]|uniref:low-density lipoprotein receptor-related protein 11 n=1 Tax=Melospiza melodia melodia TaxID=1914991 RepID=UPI002FD1380B